MMFERLIPHCPVLAVMTLFLGAFLTAIFGRSKAARRILLMLASLLSSFFMALLVKPVFFDGQIISYWMGNWAPRAGYAIGIGFEVDGLSLFFALLVSLTVLLSNLYSLRYIERDDCGDYYCTLALMLGGSVLSLVQTGDIFTMFVMIEIMTFACVALTAFRKRSEGALEAAFKYLIVGCIGSSLVLTGVILLYAQCHTLNMAQLSALLAGNLTPATVFAFALLLTGFGVKSYAVPFHFVAADAYMAAPSSVSMLFSGMVNKAGVYGVIRLCYIIMKSMRLPALQTLLVTLGTLSMFVGVTMALRQHDFKRLLAFHSISQIGYVLTALGLCTALGIAGGLYHAMNHTLFKGLLFLCAGAVWYAAGTTDLDRMGGLSKRMPQTCAIFLIAAFSISGLPPFNGFVSKWIIYQATFEKAAEGGGFGYIVVTVVALVTSVMTLASFIKVAQSVFFGQERPELAHVREVPLSMRIPMWILAVLCVVTGVAPGLVLTYVVAPATYAVTNVTGYINTMMGAGYAESVMTVPAQSIPVDASFAGYYSPVSWLILFAVLLLAFALVALLGKGSRGAVCQDDTGCDDKYAVFFGGERVTRSTVAGSDLFWGFRYNFRHYFRWMGNVHSGVVNDYAAWAVGAGAVIILYLYALL